MRKLIHFLWATCPLLAVTNELIEDQSLLTAENYRIILEPIHATSYSPQVLSPVLFINKRMGDSFKQGEVLLQLDPVIFSATYEKAKANLEKARAIYDAKQKLYEDNSVSYLDLKEAEAAALVAEADLKIAKKNLDATTILAPYNGKVAAVYIEEHELPKQDKQMLDIVDDETLIGKILIPSSLINQIRIGDPMTIVMTETGQKIQAVIKRIGAVIDPASSTLNIEVEINNKEHNLKSGMSGVATFKVREDVSVADLEFGIGVKK